MIVKEDNDMVANTVDKTPGKLVGFAGINPAEDDALDEVYRAVDMRVNGIMLDPNTTSLFVRMLGASKS